MRRFKKLEHRTQPSPAPVWLTMVLTWRAACERGTVHDAGSIMLQAEDTIAPGTQPAKVLVRGVSLSVGQASDFVAHYLALLRAKQGAMIFAPDMSLLRQAAQDARLQAAFAQAAFAINDGAPVALAARLLSGVATPRFRGVDLMRQAFAVSEPGVRHFFLGGSQPALEALAAQIKTQPNVTLAGLYSPPFTPFEAMDLDIMVEHLTAARCDVVWVFLGAPKQELVSAALHARLPQVIFVAVGAALDFATKPGREAPRALQMLGLEWAWRLAKEPKRLWRRYISTVPLGFVLLADVAVLALVRAISGGRGRFLIWKPSQ